MPPLDRFSAQAAAYARYRIDYPAAWFLDYLRTWSSVQNYLRQYGQDPVAPLTAALLPVWGKQERQVAFPVFARTGRVH